MPKLLILADELLEPLDTYFDEPLCDLSYFQNLKIIPTVMHANICVDKSNIPTCKSPKRDIPTVPIIKRGPELLVKAKRRSASMEVQIPSFLNLETIFSLFFYPLIIPIIKGKEPSPGTLNSGLIKKFRRAPSIEITLV